MVDPRRHSPFAEAITLHDIQLSRQADRQLTAMVHRQATPSWAPSLLLCRLDYTCIYLLSVLSYARHRNVSRVPIFLIIIEFFLVFYLLVPMHYLLFSIERLFLTAFMNLDMTVVCPEYDESVKSTAPILLDRFSLSMKMPMILEKCRHAHKRVQRYNIKHNLPSFIVQPAGQRNRY
ncbi:hypothetical protein GGS20DRAFT_259912 [Poronia punctata]|nr:hypothetical protein GGS20DRAFT_259912 [Poronia punctata]